MKKTEWEKEMVLGKLYFPGYMLVMKENHYFAVWASSVDVNDNGAIEQTRLLTPKEGAVMLELQLKETLNKWEWEEGFFSVLPELEAGVTTGNRLL